MTKGIVAMIAVIFEFTVREGRKDDYFDWVGKLREEVLAADGFLSIERFESLTAPDSFVSLSFWRDAEAVRAWRENPKHGQAQAAGREGIFDSFRLKTAEVMREITLDAAGNRAERDLSGG
jgi:heme-degrading monooxygenase HmoA|tara:strand:- start:720 stop:1082 length:363 start_codon:yes stop_codon:yes gene_type:complete